MISSMHLVNIQSWKDETIEFSEDLVNVVSARSEKGKTVLYKVFYQMVFPNYYKFGSRNDLIRRDSYFGEVTLELSNMTKILFHVEHKEQWFKMKRASDLDWVMYYQNNCPQEIINELGLIVDYELQYILNIYIKDNQYPFINTTKTWNAVLFNQVFKNEKLDKTIESLTEELKVLSDTQKQLQNKISLKEIQNKQMQYVNIAEIQLVRSAVNQLNQMYDILDEIYKITVKYEEHLSTHEKLKDKVFDVVDIVDIKELYTTLFAIYNVTKDLEPNLSVIERTPDYTDVSEKVNTLQKLMNTCVDVHNSSVKIENQLVNYSNSLTGIANAESVRKSVTEIRNLSDIVEELLEFTKVMDDKLLDFAKVSEDISKVSSELSEVKSKIKVCPTCKRPL